MTPNTILLLQSIGITLQMVNAGIATAIKNPVVALVIGAAIGGFQFYVQHIGNQSPAPNREAEELKKSAGAG